MTLKYSIGTIAALLVAAQCATHASPVAMATNMVGRPTFKQSDGSAKPLGVLQRLSPGDVVECGPGQEAIVMMFVNGTRFKVAANHQGVVGPTTVKGAVALNAAGGATIRVAKAMTGLDTEPFLARPASSHQRLDKDSVGIMDAANHHFEWLPLEGASTYTFTLIDQHDNIVWSTRGADTSADYPDNLPDLLTRRPYVWMLSGFGVMGKPVPETRWGIITFLSKDDADQLASDVADLKNQLASDPSDTSPLPLLAELYRQYGVLEGTLETLEDPRVSGQPGISQAIAETYASINKFAVVLQH